MAETRVDRPFKIFLASLTCNTLFAVMDIFVKLASATHPVLQIMFFRNALAMVPITAVMMNTGGFKLLRTKNPGGHFLRGLIGAASMVCFFVSYAHLPLANAVAIQATSPLMQTVLSIVLLREKVGRHRLAAVAIGLCAVIFMLHPSGSGGDITYSLTALVAAILAAFVMIIIRKIGRTENSIAIVFYFMLFGAVCSVFVLPFVWVTPTKLTLFYLVMTGLACGGAQLFMTWAYANGPTAYVSSFSYVSIIFAALADWFIWSHIIDWHIAVGATVVIVAGLYVLYRETLRRRDLTPEAITLTE